MHAPSLITTFGILSEVVNELLKHHDIPVQVSIKRLLGEPDVLVTVWETNQGTNNKITYYSSKRIPEQEFFINLPCERCGK